MKELYSNIEVCPWCGTKPSICVSQHKKTIMFDIMVGCTNEDCRFRPKCYSTSTRNGLDGFISDMISGWNNRCYSKTPSPHNIEFTVDTESKWTLSESEYKFDCISCIHQYEEKTDNSDVTDTRCLHCRYSFFDDDNYLWCKIYHKRTESAIKKCRYKDFIDETDEIKCADCKHYWYCAGEECCNLDGLSFPEPCNKFEREDSE